MLDQVGQEMLLKRIDTLAREIECLRRDLLRSRITELQVSKGKPTLFGSIRGGDVTEEMIEEAKRALFRPLEDL
ncbi:MAG: hypothetical protein FJ014_16745 [Chloroflexi bacterium]|nr:hypothetical protein [Chloroflexota bacterium]